MEYMRIAIVTDDRAYGEAAARSLLIGNRNFDLGLYECGVFCSRIDAMGQSFLEGFDLVLWDSDGAEKIYGGSIVWLTERVSQAGSSGDGRFAIYKYSPCESMVAAIFSIYEQLTGRKPSGGRPARVEVTAFVSWQGGSGCTTLAMGMGQELARFYRMRVLYLTLETVESTPVYMDVPEGMKHGGEYLYHLMAEGRSPFLEEYLIRDGSGMRAFAPAPGCNPFSIAQPEEISRLLPALMRSGQFDAILIDGGSAPGAPLREALLYADRICLVSSRQEAARENRYRAFLQHGLGSRTDAQCTARPRLIRIHNCCKGFSGDTPEGDVIRISTWESARTPLNPEGGFAKSIHELAEVCYNGVATIREAN